MKDVYNLQRFIDAQEGVYPMALAEITKGRKQSHWMWFIFPQLQGLGSSQTSKFYAIRDIDEAAAYLNNPVLGNRLIHICEVLLRLESYDAHNVFGSPDDLKLKSSITLFASVPNASPVFKAVLDTFFNGAKDSTTLQLLHG